MLFMNVSLLIAYYFSLDGKVTKDQDIVDASFAAQAFALQSFKTTGRKDLPLVSHIGHSASGKSASPLQPHRASIVLLDSSRSRSAVGEERASPCPLLRRGF
jgi:hypothetical protein